jgi:hypothetical protein
LNISLDTFNKDIRSQSGFNTNTFATSSYSFNSTLNPNALFGKDYSTNIFGNSNIPSSDLDMDLMSKNVFGKDYSKSFATGSNIFASGFALGGANLGGGIIDGTTTYTNFLNTIAAIGTEPMHQPFKQNMYSADYLKSKSRENVENYAYAPSKSYDKFDGTFESALKNVLGSEGGYSNDPDDHGGPTNHGITQRTYDSWCSRNGKTQQDVKNITQEDVKNIYYNDYWLASGADKISDPKMKLALFDTSVLHGVSGAKKLYNQSDGSLDSFLQTRKNSYNGIVDNNPSQQKFYNGWVNRTNRLG